MKRGLFLLLYYGMLRFLPEGYDHPGFGGFNKMRTWACRRLFAHCGACVNVHQRAAFGCGRNISVGDYSNLGVNVYINGRGGVTLGDNVLMGPDVIIYTGTHTYRDREIPIQRQEMMYGPVSIGEDVWLGARVIVLPGVSIGDGCVVGANSVVTKDIPPYSIVAGSPAKIIGERD